VATENFDINVIYGISRDTDYEIIWNEEKSKELPAPCILILLAWYW
jgi:hypothetical protein